jgi:hypothetical protein
VPVFHDGNDVALPSHEELFNEYINTEELATFVLKDPSSISSWNHTTVVFVLPEGQGLGKSFVLRVGKFGPMKDCKNERDCWLDRSKTVQAVTTQHDALFNYDPPRIASIDTGFEEVVKGPTKGGFTLRIMGENFGTKLGKVYIGEDPSLLDSEGGEECFLFADENNVTSQTHREISCRFPAGIGKDLDVLFVQKYPEELRIPPLEDTLVAGFSYFPPVIDAILPLSANAMSDNIIVSGREFGAVASHVEVLIGSVAEDDNVTCADAALAFRIYGDDFIAELRCSTAFAKVGPRDLQVTVAGQRAKWEGFYDFAFSCHRDYYGRTGEFCVECRKFRNCRHRCRHRCCYCCRHRCRRFRLRRFRLFRLLAVLFLKRCSFV